MGRDLKILLIDELMGFKQDIMYRVFIPMMALKIVVLCISTRPTTDDSVMSDLVKARYRNSDEHIFKTIDFPNICNRCKLQGNMNCNHVVELPWSDEKQSAKIAGLYASRPEDFNREILNIDNEPDTQLAFDKKALDALEESQEEFPPNVHVENVYVGIDPAAGGMRSKYAIVSIVPYKVYTRKRERDNTLVTENKIMIVGIDFSDARESASYDDLLIGHIHALRNHPKLSTAKIVIFPENNLGLEALNIDKKLSEHFVYDTDYVCYKNSKGNAGVFMTNALKISMRESVNTDLQRNKINVWKSLISVRKSIVVENEKDALAAAADQAREEFVTHMRNMCRVVKNHDNPNRPTTIHISGKGKGFDDLAMAGMIVLTHWEDYVRNPEKIMNTRILPI